MIYEDVDGETSSGTEELDKVQLETVNIKVSDLCKTHEETKEESKTKAQDQEKDKKFVQLSIV